MSPPYIGLPHTHTPVLASRVAAQDVSGRRDVQVLLNVMEGVLCHIGHTHVGVTSHNASASLELASQNLDERGLACGR